MSSNNLLFEIYWDKEESAKDLVKIEKYNEIYSVNINGVDAVDLLTKGILSLIPSEDKLTLRINTLLDKFGEIIIKKNNEVIRKIRVVPWKMCFRRDYSPNEVYDMITNTVFNDIKLFLSFAISHINKNIKSIESFSAEILKEFPRSLEFIVYILEESTKNLRMALRNLFKVGPIHKQIIQQKSYFGTKLMLQTVSNPTPYKYYVKQQHTQNTPLNIMTFQSAYFILATVQMIKENAIHLNSPLKERLHKIDNMCKNLLTKYYLWNFFSLEPLDDSELKLLLVSQTNIYYRDIYKIFKIARNILLFFSIILAVQIETGTKMPISEFYHIYEIWAVSRVLASFVKKEYTIINISLNTYRRRHVTMYFNLRNEKEKTRVSIIWELKFKPVLDSTYYGGLLKALDFLDKKKFEIKPDLVIIVESEKIKKVYIGDVKFQGSETLQLPKLDSLYKVLSYVEDLKRSDLFNGFSVEGLLIFPGNIKPTRVPDVKNENYINVIPLNLWSEVNISDLLV